MWDCESGTPEITAVRGREGGDLTQLTISAPMNGALNINWLLMRLVTLRAGRIERRSNNVKPEIISTLGYFGQLMSGGSELLYLNQTILAIANEGHGGAVWIMREGLMPDSMRAHWVSSAAGRTFSDEQTELQVPSVNRSFSFRRRGCCY